MSRAAAPHLLCFGRRAARRAMTLLELLTVITIMSVLMGVTFPTLRAFNEKNKLRATVREIVALMKYARTEAVFGQRTTEVFFDLDKRQFWVDLREPDPRTGEYNPKHKKRQLEEKRSLNQDLWFDEVTTYDDNIIGDRSEERRVATSSWRRTFSLTDRPRRCC
jgi:prepilin-type N-terminal cleavage/methylation domain-containing protein